MHPGQVQKKEKKTLSPELSSLRGELGAEWGEIIADSFSSQKFH